MNMTFGEFQQSCAGAGFVYTPLTFRQWWKASHQLGDVDAVYGVACDVACGVSFNDAVRLAVWADVDAGTVSTT